MIFHYEHQMHPTFPKKRETDRLVSCIDDRATNNWVYVLERNGKLLVYREPIKVKVKSVLPEVAE